MRQAGTRVASAAGGAGVVGGTHVGATGYPVVVERGGGGGVVPGAALVGDGPTGVALLVNRWKCVIRLATIPVVPMSLGCVRGVVGTERGVLGCVAVGP